VKKRNTKPTASKLSVLGQLCNLIPPHLVSKLARETGVASMARSFSPWSHVVSMLFAQLTHAIGLNDVCDALRLHSGPLSALRGATAPRAATIFLTPISAATPRWPNGSSGRCSITSQSFLPDLAPDVEVKDWPGVFGASFMWWTRARSR
jgi:hypothetical protein